MACSATGKGGRARIPIRCLTWCASRRTGPADCRLLTPPSIDTAFVTLMRWNRSTARSRGPVLDLERWLMAGPCIHQCYEAQAALTPDAVAVAWDGGALTFRELDERANRFAH